MNENGDPTVTLPAALVQEMVDILSTLPYRTAAPVLTKLQVWQANQRQQPTPDDSFVENRRSLKEATEPDSGVR